MVWVLLAVFVVSLIVNAPLIYDLIVAKNRAMVPTLWGYSPHQFFFVLFIFPFATFCTFTGMYVAFSKLGPSLPDSFSGKWLFDNAVGLLLLALVFIGMVGFGDYLSSTRSLDKLRPEYSKRAVSTICLLNDQLDRSDPAKREEQRVIMIKGAQKAKDALVLPPRNDTGVTSSWVQKLPDPVFLQVAQDPFLQRRLNLLDPGAYVLSTIQVVVSLFVACCALLTIAAAVIVHASPDVPQPLKTGTAFEDLIKALFGAVAAFGFYPILFQQYRSEIEPLVGNSNTTMQHALSGALVVGMLVVLTFIYPPQKEVGETIGKMLPSLLVAIIFGVEAKAPLMVRQLVGAEANVGRQISLVTVFVLIMITASFLVWPKR